MEKRSRRTPRGNEPLVQRVFYRWGSAEILLLLRESKEGLRFSEICRGLPGISEQIISSRLGDLREIGMLRREVADETPVAVTYSLTGLGCQLADAAETIKSIAISDQLPVQVA